MKTLGDYRFPFKTTGKLQFDPGKGTKHFRENWCLALLDEEIGEYYSWLLCRYGLDTFPANKLWGFHVSVIKGQRDALAKNQEQWAEKEGHEVEIWYSGRVNFSNGRHAWIDCYSEDLVELRQNFGLDINEGKLKYHATLGRLKKPFAPDVKRPGYIYKNPNGVATL